MEPRHVADVVLIERACFSQPWSRRMLEGEIENPQAFYLVAEQDGALAGYAGMHGVLDEGYITNVATAPAFRRRGVAGALLTALIAHARTLSLAFLTLEVRVSNAPAVALYEKHGFVPVGVRRQYYRVPREDALLMTKYL
jgi:ribosomal-protein-alanine N-acetyltransferase